MPPVTVTSSVVKPVTASLKVNVAVSSLVALILSEMPVMDSVGTMPSQVAVALSALVGPVLRPSVALLAATVTVRFLLSSGVMTNVYSVALVAVNVPLSPLVTVTSLISKSVTASLKVKVAVRFVVLLILAGIPVISTVGAAVSQVAVALWALAGPRLSPSVTAFLRIVTTTLLP